MKCVAGKNETKFSCFGHKFGTLAAFGKGMRPFRMTDMHMKNDIIIWNMIYEQNMMKCDAGEKYTKLSCFDQKFGTLAVILKMKTAILND